MLRTILNYGVAAGLIVGVPLTTYVLTMSGHGIWDMVISYLMMLVALSLIFLAIKQRRDVELGGVIRFWPALGMGLGISLVAGILYVLVWEAGQAISGADFMSDYARSQLAERQAAGASAAELARLAAEMEALRAQFANPLFRLPMIFAEIFPVGVLVSLVSAGLLCNPRVLPARRTAGAE